jgi:hypothetical protein
MFRTVYKKKSFSEAVDYIDWQGSISLSQNHGESTTYSLTLLWLPKLRPEHEWGCGWVYGEGLCVGYPITLRCFNMRGRGLGPSTWNLSWQKAFGSPSFELARPQAIPEKVIRR